MPTASQVQLAKLVVHDQIANSYYDDSHMVGCKTPDYQKIYEEVPNLITSPEDLKGEVDGMPVATIVKLAMRGGFEGQLSDSGRSADNYKMIAKLYEATKEDKAFWEEVGTTPVDDSVIGPKRWHATIGNMPAAQIAAIRMSYESFTFGDRKEKIEDMAAATELSEKLRSIPAFQKEFESLSRFSNLQTRYEELSSNPELKAAGLENIRAAAKSLISQDFESLTQWKSGPLGIELEAAAKVHLFLGKSDIPIFEKLLSEELKKKATPPKVEPDMEPS